MKMFNPVRLSRRAAILAVVATGMLGGTASAAVNTPTLDPSARLSPGHLHAYLTGTITCDAGRSVSLNGQVVQTKKASGFGFTVLMCTGASQAYTIDVSAGGGFPGTATGAFKPGRASAQVTATVCDPFTFPDPGPFPPLPPPPFPTCSTAYTDGIIRLVR